MCVNISNLRGCLSVFTHQESLTIKITTIKELYISDYVGQLCWLLGWVRSAKVQRSFALLAQQLMADQNQEQNTREIIQIPF